METRIPEMEHAVWKIAGAPEEVLAKNPLPLKSWNGNCQRVIVTNMPMNEKHTDETRDGRHPEEAASIDKKDIGKVRHDEPVTVKGVARALLMADEPGQRMNVEPSGSAKSDSEEPGASKE